MKTTAKKKLYSGKDFILHFQMKQKQIMNFISKHRNGKCIKYNEREEYKKKYVWINPTPSYPYIQMKR
jgi:hypothetical protein